MKEKDVTEKILEDYGDVFSDIVNGLIFGGECVVDEDELEDIQPLAQYKAFDAKLHEEERDVVKRWKSGLINIAVLGVENQSAVFKPMPLRVIGYDGASYRSQLTEYDALVRKWEHERKTDDSVVNAESGEEDKACDDAERREHHDGIANDKTDNKTDDKTGYIASSEKSGIRPEFHPVPVLTIVLYFGNEHWTKNLCLKELLDIPPGMDRFINDYKINGFEVAWLNDGQIAMFRSDFKVVADFFSKKRRNPEYVPDDITEIRHVDEVLKLISAVSGDERYAEIAGMDDSGKGRIKNMCDVAERLDRRGFERGIEQGITQGLSKGRILQVIEDTCWKLFHGYSQEIIEIGSEEQISLIRKICAIADKYAPTFDSEKIYDELFSKNN